MKGSSLIWSNIVYKWKKHINTLHNEYTCCFGYTCISMICTFILRYTRFTVLVWECLPLQVPDEPVVLFGGKPRSPWQCVSTDCVLTKIQKMVSIEKFIVKHLYQCFFVLFIISMFSVDYIMWKSVLFSAALST